MDYKDHNSELEFKLLLRQRLTRQGVASVMEEVTEELLALAEFLEDSEDYPAAERYRSAASTLDDATAEVIESLQEK